ncbi:MAG: selenide, water dikinase SelD [Chloroflexi bacterium]|nr:selenide, water dikinase SelD [Chloroflexota bacterium]
MAINPIKLTSLAGAAGCAAKLGAGDLSAIAFPLGKLFDTATHPNLMVGLAEPDDAAVYKLNDTQAVISTTDFFPPVVDDPYWFGAIAAANAMSDVYAMGGEVLMAINLCAFPASLDLAVLGEILRGGAEKVQEAGAVIAGGHTIMDEEPKYGLAVTGMVHPDRVLTKGGAQAGDALILTKPLGAGVITTALKQGKAHEAHVENAMKIMATLNREAARIAQQIGVHAMTDVTGYSLLGHGREMAKLSGMNLHIKTDELHWMDGVWEYAEQGIFPGGMGRNRSFYGKWAQFADEIDEKTCKLLFDPQTSGGLLMAVAYDQADMLLQTLIQQGIDGQRIGEVAEGEGLIIVE